LTILRNRSGKIIDIVDPTIPEKRPKTNISKFKVLFYPKEKVEVLNDII
jgi:fructose-1,6-bisphosphatase